MAAAKSTPYKEWKVKLEFDLIVWVKMPKI